MHLKRGEIHKVFSDHLSPPASDDPETLTMFARDVMRQKYLDADVGITGANFGVAETWRSTRTHGSPDLVRNTKSAFRNPRARAD